MVSTTVFPSHSLNHDEGVYLTQASMLLEGQLTLEPPVPAAMRPWFFVADGSGGFYPKYAPVPAALFAVGGLVGWFRLALGLIAAGTIGLTYATVAEAFDRRVGVVAAALLLGSPLFLVQASVFLPYVPTLFLELLFAWSLLRAERTGSDRMAVLSGAAIGLAFVARPWTAFLFALPFVALVAWRLRQRSRSVLRRALLTAVPGLLGVLAALGYNALVTGDPLTFPYEAFAPLDGLGFGRRRLLGYDLVYTPALALRAGLENLLALLGRWTVAAPLGGLLAAAGVVLALRRRAQLLDVRRLAIAGLFLTVPVGELYFWGTRNVLGDLDRAGDGLIGLLGPYYHLDLLLPLVAFGGFALVRAWDWALRRYRAVDGREVRATIVAGLVVVAGLGAVATAGAVAGPLAANDEVTDTYEVAYEPFEDRSLEHAVVFLPDPYGDWLAHPFQALRTDPGYDGPVVYALEERPFAVADAFPERQLYRYSYRGHWEPRTGDPVTPRLRRVDRVRSDRVLLDLTAGVPAGADFVSIRADSGAGHGAATVPDPPESLSLTVTIGDDTARIEGPALADPVTVPIRDRDALEVRLLVDFGGLDALPYRVAVPLATTPDGERRALSPRLEVCDRPSLCGGEATFVPGAYREGVSLNASVRGLDR